MKYEERTVERKNIYKGGIIDVDCLTVELPDGRKAKRDIVIHPGASAIIPLTDNAEIYMVRQYRKPIEKECLEIPAGKLDKDENPLDCAIRELKEETGLTANCIKHVVSIHSTPGFSNEILHIYIATGLSEGAACTDEDEFISIEKIPVKNLIEMVFDHKITDAKSIIGILIADKILKGEIKI